MSEKEKQILETFDKVIPYLSEVEKEKLLAFGEGLGFAVKANSPDRNGSALQVTT